MSDDDNLLSRLIKMMGMTTSDNDGQALVALRAANRELVKLGKTWDDVLRGKIKVVANPFADIPQPAAPRMADVTPTRSQTFQAAKSAAKAAQSKVSITLPVRTLLAEIEQFSNFGGSLTPYEQNFLADMLAIRDGRSVYSGLTSRQEHLVVRIHAERVLGKPTVRTFTATNPPSWPKAAPKSVRPSLDDL